MSEVLYMLDNDMEIVSVIDDYISLLWTERYSEIGDFEMELPYYRIADAGLVVGYFVYAPFSNVLMVVGDIKHVKGDEEPDKVHVLGFSVKHMLTWRVFKLAKSYSTANVRTIATDLLNEEFISPTDSDRTMPHLVIDPNFATDTDFDSLTHTGDYRPIDVYHVLKTMCDDHEAGIRILFDTSTRQLIFSLYIGDDHSYGQSTNPYVVFSENYDNLKSSEYYITGMDYRNVCLQDHGENDEGSNLYVSRGAGPHVGLNRREMTIQTELQTVPPGIVLTHESRNALIPRDLKGIFEGDVDISSTFSYGTDFQMGDVVQCIFSNINKKARVIELVTSINDQGRNVYASFDFDVL